MKKIGIYKIVSKIDGKVYVGRSKNIVARLADHFKLLKVSRHPNRHIQSAFNKYGRKNFHYEILCRCDISQLQEREAEFIALYNSLNDQYGYNIQTELRGSVVVSQETKIKLRSLRVGKKVYGFSLNGEFIKEWVSISECAMELKVSPCDVRRTINQQQRFCKGYVLNDEKVFRMRESRRKENYKNFGYVALNSVA